MTGEFTSQNWRNVALCQQKIKAIEELIKQKKLEGRIF
jgi:hypothetical protein